MAKATIVLEDIEATGEVKINVDFDPPITQGADPSYAANMALSAVRHLTETYTQTDGSSEPPTDVTPETLQ